MHKQSSHKAVVHALGRRNEPKLFTIAAQHLLTESPVVLILHGIHRFLQPLPGLVHLNGRRGHQVADPVVIVLLRQADTVDRHLGRPPVLGGQTRDPSHLTHIALADGTRVVPHLGRDRAAAVHQVQRQEGLSRRRGALGNVLQNVIPLKPVSVVHIVYQHYSLSFSYIHMAKGRSTVPSSLTYHLRSLQPCSVTRSLWAMTRSISSCTAVTALPENSTPHSKCS